MLLGEYIRKYRHSHGDMSQADFASLSGISKGYISMLENNKNPQSKRPISPTMDTFQKVAIATGVSINELFSIVESPVQITRKKTFSMADAIEEILEYYKPSEDEQAPLYVPTSDFAQKLQARLKDKLGLILTQSENDKKNNLVTLRMDVFSRTDYYKIAEELFSCEKHDETSVERRLVEVLDCIPDEGRRLKLFLSLLNAEGYNKTLAYVRDLAENPRYRRDGKDLE